MKIKLLFFAVAALLMSACSSDDIDQPDNGGDKGFAPKIHATVQESPLTKAGVIEENDYTLGEKFYWSVDDATAVFFSGDELEYKVMAVGEPRNQATFATEGILPEGAGIYDVMGYFPASAWRYGYMREGTVPAEQTQTDKTSKHLGAHMLMIAKNAGVAVDDENPINLHYKHMASVLRFAVWNNSAIPKLRLTKINLKSPKAVFGIRGKVQDQHNTPLTITMHTSSIGLSLTNTAQEFADKDGMNLCEGYMVVLPTTADAFALTDNLTLELNFTDGAKYYTASYAYNVGTDLGFLTGGIEQGSSYYIQQKVAFDDIHEVQTYSVGDYYPNPEDQTSATGLVYWLDNPTAGKSVHGRIVSLDEGINRTWGEDVTTNATNTSNGMDNMNVIKDIAGWEEKYPAFAWCDSKEGDWYLPAKDELKALYASYSGKRIEDITEWNDHGSMPGYDDAACELARTAFNSKLTAAGGTALRSSWSSSEIDDFYAWIVLFNDGSTSNFDDKTLNFRVRAVSAF